MLRTEIVIVRQHGRCCSTSEKFVVRLAGYDNLRAFLHNYFDFQQSEPSIAADENIAQAKTVGANAGARASAGTAARARAGSCCSYCAGRKRNAALQSLLLRGADRFRGLRVGRVPCPTGHEREHLLRFIPVWIEKVSGPHGEARDGE
jgi:hypothetical protein